MPCTKLLMGQLMSFQTQLHVLILLFTSRPGLVVDSGIQPTLFPRCHHQMIFSRIHLQTYFPTVYSRHVWNVSRTNVDFIRRDLSSAGLTVSLNLNVSDQVEFLPNYILNIFSDSLPNKIITSRNKNTPWMTV